MEPGAYSSGGEVCPTCGANIGSGNHRTNCPVCGASLVENIAPVTEEQRIALSELAESANERLEKAGAESAEQSFGLGCALGALPLLAAIFILFITGVFNLIMALITLVTASLVLAGIATLASSFAKARTVRETYRSVIGPEIDTFLNSQQLARTQFEKLVYELLPEESPLRAYRLVQPPPNMPLKQE
ncbi:MAG: hypothetical protein EHM70_21890 [Chloroflexota bacterium]|nr:MAG: hypothetical protein EHM70_21890 [Chloroflexota bacterium]